MPLIRKVIRVTYEILPSRAMEFLDFEDEGQSDVEVKKSFSSLRPSALIWRIDRIDKIEDV